MIENDDSDRANNDDQEIKVDQIGTILVKVFRVNIPKRSRPQTATATNWSTFKGLQAVPENRLKGKALSTLQSKYCPYAPVWKILLANLYTSALDQANPIKKVPLGVTIGNTIALMVIFQYLLLSLSIIPGVSPPTP